MFWNRQEYVCSNDYNFADFGRNKLEILHCKIGPHELSAESKANRVDIYQEILEVMEKLGPRQKNHVITSDECCIYWDNYHRGQWITDRRAVSPQMRTTISSKRSWFRRISLAKGLFSSKYFRK
jgi:hypothetical protein